MLQVTSEFIGGQTAGDLAGAVAVLIVESRLALGAIHREMDFVWSVGQQHAPSELLMSRPPKWWRSRRLDE